RQLLVETHPCARLCSFATWEAVGERLVANMRELDDRRLGAVGEVRVAVAELLRQVELEPLGELRCAQDGVAVVGGALQRLSRREQDRLEVAAPLGLAAVERGVVAERDGGVLA